MATIYSTETRPRPLVARRVITLEQGLYLLLGLLAALLHLYALGSRALHHDETLHAQYSWRLYNGEAYQHDPLLHGPFLYYITAAGYMLFGANDATARITVALFGIALTLLPVLLRRELGRGGALLATAYLLISPVALYVGRFIRHDMYAVVFELLMVIGLVRYIRTERSRWHYIVAAAAALMLTDMETFYLFLLIWGSFVGGWLLWQVSRRALAVVGGYLVVVVAALKVLPKLGIGGALPNVSEQDALNVRNQPNNDLGDYFRKVGAVLKPFVSHPSIIMILVATVALIAAVVALVWLVRDRDGTTAWQRATATAAPGTLLYAVARIPRHQWAMAWLLAFGIYAMFYTAIIPNAFSTSQSANPAGLITGISGSFLYWLGQHSVRRGGQPAHFYLFEIGLYEPLLILGGLAGLALVIRRLVRSRRAAREFATADIDTDDTTEAAIPARRWSTSLAAHEALFFPGLLAWWSLAALAIYSWAGEKMPWLTVHMVLPLTLLSAWAVGRLAAWAWHDGFDRRLVGLLLAVTTFAGLCLLRLNMIGTRLKDADMAGAVKTAWLWPVLLLLVCAAAITLAGLLRGRRGALALALAITGVLLLPYTLRGSLRLSFQTGDTPVEPMVFVQTSPDVTTAMAQLDRADKRFGGNKQLRIRYDNETVWQWYLRDYKNNQGSGSTVVGPVGDDVQALFLLYENANNPANQEYLEGFVSQRYPLRWWLPECDVYRFPTTDKDCGPNPNGSSLLSRMLSKPFDGPTIAEWWQFAMYRQVPNGLGSSDWVLLVRPNLADTFGLGAGPKP